MPAVVLPETVMLVIVFEIAEGDGFADLLAEAGEVEMPVIVEANGLGSATPDGEASGLGLGDGVGEGFLVADAGDAVIPIAADCEGEGEGEGLATTGGI